MIVEFYTSFKQSIIYGNAKKRLIVGRIKWLGASIMYLGCLDRVAGVLFMDMTPAPSLEGRSPGIDLGPSHPCVMILSQKKRKMYTVFCISGFLAYKFTRLSSRRIFSCSLLQVRSQYDKQVLIFTFPELVKLHKSYT